MSPCRSTARRTPWSNLDRYLHAISEVLNAGAPGRPPLFYMAHVALRHRCTQSVLIMPPPVQAVLFPAVVLVGTLLGKYRNGLARLSGPVHRRP